MRALSVKQPWSDLIRSGRKTIELRTWTTSYRGELAICAGASFDPEGVRFPDGPRGVTRAVVDLYDIRPATADDADDAGETREGMERYIATSAARGRTVFAWLVRDPRPTAAVRVSGKLGLFTVGDHLL